MKKLYLLSTRPWIYISEIPLAVLFTLAAVFNGQADGVWKLYPLLIALGGVMIFILAYFFKVLIISTDEVESFSLMRGGEVATLNKGKTLIIGRISRTRIGVSVYGNDGTPDFDFIKNDADYKPIDIFLLRAKALGGTGAVKRIMKYFDIPEENAVELLAPGVSYDAAALSAVSEKNESGFCDIRITFKKTL